MNIYKRLVLDSLYILNPINVFRLVTDTLGRLYYPEIYEEQERIEQSKEKYFIDKNCNLRLNWKHPENIESIKQSIQEMSDVDICKK